VRGVSGGAGRSLSRQASERYVDRTPSLTLPHFLQQLRYDRTALCGIGDRLTPSLTHSLGVPPCGRRPSSLGISTSCMVVVVPRNPSRDWDAAPRGHWGGIPVMATIYALHYASYTLNLAGRPPPLRGMQYVTHSCHP